MNEADRAPSPNRFCRKFGMRNAALNASAASDTCPKYLANRRSLTSPAMRLRRMPAATSAAARDVLRAGVDCTEDGPGPGTAESRTAVLLADREGGRGHVRVPHYHELPPPRRDVGEIPRELI